MKLSKNRHTNTLDHLSTTWKVFSIQELCHIQGGTGNSQSQVSGDGGGTSKKEGEE
ncbi:MAG: hypothetical protein AAFX87_06510 [Bacteroidota bacterium]